MFQEFFAKNLTHLEEKTHDFFGTDLAKDTIRHKVAVLFPEHEVESFTEHFWNRIQNWRKSIG